MQPYPGQVQMQPVYYAAGGVPQQMMYVQQPQVVGAQPMMYYAPQQPMMVQQPMYAMQPSGPMVAAATPSATPSTVSPTTVSAGATAAATPPTAAAHAASPTTGVVTTTASAGVSPAPVTATATASIGGETTTMAAPTAVMAGVQPQIMMVQTAQGTVAVMQPQQQGVQQQQQAQQPVKPKRDPQPEWSHKWSDFCIHGPLSCLYAFFCVPCASDSALEVLTGRQHSFITGGLCLCDPESCICEDHRVEIVRDMGIEEPVLQTVCLSLCCPQVSMVQIYNESLTADKNGKSLKKK